MELIDAFGIDVRKPQVIAFVGGGGKSSTMYRLATELRTLGQKVLVTTTTMIFHPEVKIRPCDIFFTGKAETLVMQNSAARGTITVAGRNLIETERKIKGFSKEEIEYIRQSELFDILLVEADGARGRPIKAPAPYEPVLPLNTDIAAGIIGMDSVGTEIDEKNIHRPEIFTTLTKTAIGDILTPVIVAKLIISNRGLFKDTSPKSRKIVIFNKSETLSRISAAKEIAGYISESIGIDRILITSMTENDYESYHRHEAPGNDLSAPPVMAVIKL